MRDLPGGAAFGFSFGKDSGFPGFLSLSRFFSWVLSSFFSQISQVEFFRQNFNLDLNILETLLDGVLIFSLIPNSLRFSSKMGDSAFKIGLWLDKLIGSLH